MARKKKCPEGYVLNKRTGECDVIDTPAPQEKPLGPEIKDYGRPLTVPVVEVSRRAHMGKKTHPDKIKHKGGIYVRADLYKTAKDEEKPDKNVVPEEVATAIKNSAGNDKGKIQEILKELKGVLAKGEISALQDFARKHKAPYEALRGMLHMHQPKLHVEEHLVDGLQGLVAQLDKAGIVDALTVDKDTLWACWTKALDKAKA